MYLSLIKFPSTYPISLFPGSVFVLPGWTIPEFLCRPCSKESEYLPWDRPFQFFFKAFLFSFNLPSICTPLFICLWEAEGDYCLPLSSSPQKAGVICCLPLCLPQSSPQSLHSRGFQHLWQKSPRGSGKICSLLRSQFSQTPNLTSWRVCIPSENL